MRKGLVGYSNETINVSQEALYQMSESAIGIPVIIDHPDDEITPDNVNDIPIIGRVSEFVYDVGSDNWYANFIVDDQAAVDLLNDGWGVSTAWFGDEYKEGGTINNVPFDRELVRGRYEHLAIVKEPRYEMARNPIFLNSKPCITNINDSKINFESNLKNKKGPTMINKIFKIFTKREEIATTDGEEIFVNVNGSEMPLSKLILNEKEEKEEKEKEDDKKIENEMIDLDGEKITVNELIKRYKASRKKSNESSDSDDKEEKKNNEEDPQEEKEEKVKKELEDVEKAIEDEEKAEKGEGNNSKKKNSKESDDAEKEAKENFEKIKYVHENGISYELESEFISTKERVEMGKNRYGK
jgi:hypothetical protein